MSSGSTARPLSAFRRASKVLVACLLCLSSTDVKVCCGLQAQPDRERLRRRPGCGRAGLAAARLAVARRAVEAVKNTRDLLRVLTTKLRLFDYSRLIADRGSFPGRLCCWADCATPHSPGRLWCSGFPGRTCRRLPGGAFLVLSLPSLVLSLVFAAFHCLSLTYLWLSLTFRCLSLTFHCRWVVVLPIAVRHTAFFSFFSHFLRDSTFSLCSHCLRSF